jgi:GntR family transcriptional regulator
VASGPGNRYEQGETSLDPLNSSWRGGRAIRRSPTLAQQAALALIDEMRSGRLAAPDGLIPSEAILSQRLGVSRATLREAMTQLEQRGMVLRRQGVGTFVNPNQPLIDFGLEELESIEALARRTDVEIHMAECDIEERPAMLAEAERLCLTPGAAVLAFRRVILSGDRRVAFLSDVVPADVLDEDELAAFDGSVLDLFLRRGHPALERSLTEISAESAADEMASALCIPVGSPLLRFDALLYSTDGRVVDSSTSQFVPGPFTFHIVRRVTQFSSPDPSLQAGSTAPGGIGRGGMGRR